MCRVRIDRQYGGQRDQNGNLSWCSTLLLASEASETTPLPGVSGPQRSFSRIRRRWIFRFHRWTDWSARFISPEELRAELMLVHVLEPAHSD